MKKTVILLVILLLISIVIFALYSNFKPSITGKAIVNYHTYTKTICNETNFCQSYEIFCNGGQVITMEPVSDVIQYPSDWVDPRNEFEKENLC